MRLLFLTDSAQVHGAEAYLLDLIANTDLTRHTVFVGMPAAGELSHSIAGSGIRFFLLPFPRPAAQGFTLRNSFQAMRAAGHLAAYLKRESIDLVHSWTTTAHLVGGLAARRAGIPALWHARRLLPLNRLRGMLDGTARYVLSPWKHITSGLVDADIGPERIREIPEGIDYRAVAPCPGEPLPERAMLPDDAFVLALIARRMGGTQLQKIIRAARTAAHEDPRVALWVIGEKCSAGFPPASFQPAPNADEPITYLGLRDDMRSLYQAIDCVILPAGVGSSGRVALEAMCAGKAIIVEGTEDGKARYCDELLSGRECLRVAFNHETALTDAILSLSRDRERAQVFGEAARQHCAEHHLIGHTIQALKQVHEEVMGGED